MKPDAMNDCRRVNDDLKAFRDRELSPGRRLTVRRHLARCASCREEVQTMQQLHHDLRAGFETDALLPPALRTRILTQLEDAAGQAPRRAAPERPWLLRYGFAASLAVNAALVVLLVQMDLLKTPRSAPSAAETPAAPSSPFAPSTPFRSAGSGGYPGGGANPSANTPAPRPREAVHAPQPSLGRNAPAPLVPSAKAMPPATAGPLPHAMIAPPPAVFVPPAPPLPRVVGRSLRDENRQKAVQAQNGMASSGTVSDAVPPPVLAPAPSTPAAKTAPSERNAVRAGGPAPAGGFGGNSFGGGGFGGGGFGGGRPSTQETTSADSMAGAAPTVAPPPPATQSAPEPTPGIVRLQAPASAEAVGLAADKPAPAPDRAAPSPVGTWPKVALPFGLDPSALVVKAVTVTWDVDEQGRVFHVRFKTTGDAQLDGAIRAAVNAGRYQPATRRGRPIKATLTHTFPLTPAP